MTIPAGTWGYGRWGSAVWGWGMVGILGSGTVVSAALMEALYQTTPTNLEVSFQVLLDSVDFSEYVESVTTKNFGLGSATMAEITFIGDSVSGLVIRSTNIEIIATIETGSGDFSGTIFKGKPYIQKPIKGSKEQSVVVTCYDGSFILDETAPINTTYSGSAATLIYSELNNCGFSAIDSTFEDYTITSLNCQQYQTARDLVNAVAQGRRKTYCFLDTDDVFKVYDTSNIPAIAWAIPLTGQTDQQEIDNANSKYNKVTASNNAGDSYEYNNTDWQAIQGTLPATVSCPLCENTTHLANFAGAFAAESQAAEYQIETPINPFISIGQEVGFETESGDGKSIRVEEITRYISFPSGAWQKIRGKVYPIYPETVEFIDDIPIVFDSTVTAWQGRTTSTDWGGAGISYPQFTIAVATTIKYIMTLHEFGGTPGTIKLKNVGTLVEYGPYSLSVAERWGNTAFFEYYDATGFSIPAGTYQIIDSDTDGWGVLCTVSSSAISTYGDPIAQVRGDPT